MRLRRCKHPDDYVALSPPDYNGYHIAYCSQCNERFVWHDHTVSDRFIAMMRKVGMNEEHIARVERANEIYRAKRERYERQTSLS